MKADIDILSGLHRHDLGKDYAAECHALDNALNLIDEQRKALRLRGENARLLRAFLKQPHSPSVPQSLYYYFAERGLLLKECTTVESTAQSDRIDYESAKTILAHLDAYRPFCEEYLKWRPGDTFTYDLRGKPNDHYTFLNGLCWKLSRQKALSFTDEDRLLTITIPKETHKTTYLVGGWGEHLVLYHIRKVLSDLNNPDCTDNPDKRPFKYRTFANLRLSQPSDSNISMELDIAVLVNDSHLYIFESKCGEILQIDKWVDRARIFETVLPERLENIPDEHYPSLRGRYITCTSYNTISHKYFQPFRLINFDTFDTVFRDMLLKDAGRAVQQAPARPQPPPPEPGTTVAPYRPEEIRNFFPAELKAFFAEHNLHPNMWDPQKYYTEEGATLYRLAEKINEHAKTFGTFVKSFETFRRSERAKIDLTTYSPIERKFIEALCDSLRARHIISLYRKSDNCLSLELLSNDLNTFLLGGWYIPIIVAQLNQIQNQLPPNENGIPIPFEFLTELTLNNVPANDTGTKLSAVLLIDHRLLYILSAKPGLNLHRDDLEKWASRFEVPGKSLRHIRYITIIPPTNTIRKEDFFPLRLIRLNRVHTDLRDLILRDLEYLPTDSLSPSAPPQTENPEPPSPHQQTSPALTRKQILYNRFFATHPQNTPCLLQCYFAERNAVITDTEQAVTMPDTSGRILPNKSFRNNLSDFCTWRDQISQYPLNETIEEDFRSHSTAECNSFYNACSALADLDILDFTVSNRVFTLCRRETPYHCFNPFSSEFDEALLAGLCNTVYTILETKARQASQSSVPPLNIRMFSHVTTVDVTSKETRIFPAILTYNEHRVCIFEFMPEPEADDRQWVTKCEQFLTTVSPMPDSPIPYPPAESLLYILYSPENGTFRTLHSGKELQLDANGIKTHITENL